MNNIAMVVEYDGSKFFGFQKQKGDVRTIQGEIEHALKKFTNTEINITTAGRTDTKVHALFQVINFKTELKRELISWQRGVNTHLPLDIVIKEVVIVPDEFNARFNAVSRTYHYYLLVDRVGSAILDDKVGHLPTTKPFDINNVRQASQYLIGKHDFSSFRASQCQANTAIRTMINVDVISINDKLYRFEFTANAFLHHMARNIVGALVYVGVNKLSVPQFKDMFLAEDRTKAPPTFMPDGLYLTNVEYDNKYFSYKIMPPFICM